MSEQTIAARRTGASEDAALAWECRIPLLTNRYILWDLLRVVVISLGLMQVLIAAIGWLVDGEALLLPVEVLGITAGVVIALTVIAMLVVLLNRYDMRFTVSAKGVGYESGRRERRVNRVVLALALLSGRPGTIGSALLGYAGESGFFPWCDIRKVTVHSADRVISLSNSWRTVLRLYCPPAIYDEALAQVQARAAEAARRREEHGRPRPRRSAQRCAAWIALAAAATVGTTAWYWVDEESVRLAVLGGVVVLVAGLLPGLAGWLVALPGIGLALYFLGCLAVAALDQTTFAWGGTSYGYEFDTPFLAVAVLGTIALLALGVYRLRDREA